MAGRFSEQLEEAGRLVERADELRVEACELADEDARVYAAVLEAYRRPRDDDQRAGAIRESLASAADVPLALVGCAREVGTLGTRVAREGNPNLRGDACTGVLLADAAARSAAYLVRLNVEAGDLGTERSDRAAAWCAELCQAVQAVSEDRM